MRRVTNRNPDGRYVHACLDCGLAITNDAPATVWLCKCPQRLVMRLPTVSTGPRPSPPPPRPPRFKFAKRPCAYLGPETGEPIKISCGNRYRRARECFCHERPVPTSKRTGEPLALLAADNFWCNDLGPSTFTPGRALASCRHCPYRIPQTLLEAPQTLDSAQEPDPPARLEFSPENTLELDPFRELVVDDLAAKPIEKMRNAQNGGGETIGRLAIDQST